MEKVLLFFSGGNDSTLSACKLASKGYDVQLITFDNGCEENLENIQNRATVLENLFFNSRVGKVHNLGVFNSISEFMNMRYQSGNMPISYMLNNYGDLNQNQLNCLNCRTAMYVVGVVVAKTLGVKYIAEGARKSQKFVIEQPIILERYRDILERYNIQLLLPVLNYENDYDVENELLMYSLHFDDKIYQDTNHYESKCVLGLPMKRNLTDNELYGYGKFFDDNLLQSVLNDIENYSSHSIEEQLNNSIYSKIKLR